MGPTSNCRRDAGRAGWTAIGAVFISSGVGACDRSLPPFGEAVVFVDTDLAVPRFAGRLRVDLYGEDGTWYESRDIARAEGANWPVSFSVFTEDETRDKPVLARLRVYPEGKTREYRGESYEPPTTYTQPFAPRSVDDLCASAPALTFGKSATLRPRTARTPLCADPSSGCVGERALNVAGVRARVERTGRYRFAVVASYPGDQSGFPSLPVLALRADCAEPASQLAWGKRTLDANSNPLPFPSVEAELAPGEYTLLLGSADPDPVADFVVRADLAETFTATDPPPPEQPRLVRGGVDETPETEPQPNLTVDRLVKLVLRPGVRQEVSVTLRGACIGTMARLSETAPFQRPVFAEAATCVGTEKTLVPVTEPAAGHLDSSVQGSFAFDDPCEPTDASGALVCIPGGMFLLGDAAVSGEVSVSKGVPERLARTHRFWLDRNEVTVARFRRALERGMSLPRNAELVANDSEMATSSVGNVIANCTWADALGTREDFPLNCVGWSAARAFCRFEGGDLPTEAQWEYAATAAARPFESTYGWSIADERSPTCARAVFARMDNLMYPASYLEFTQDLPSLVSDVCFRACKEQGGSCVERPYGVRPVGARPGPDGDTTPLGVEDMAGNVSEWVLDEAQPYTGSCWKGATLDDPVCPSDEVAPYRVFRGGSWESGVAGLRSALRGAHPEVKGSNYGTPYLGFRCAYVHLPAAKR